MKTALTIGGFVAAAALLAMAAVLIGSLNLILNGYHRECGIWRNVVPFACTPAKSAPPGVRYGAQSETGRALLPLPRPVSSSSQKVSQKPKAGPKPPNNPHTGRREPWGCGSLQPEPYRVQGDYHDLGFRADCGLAHDWSDRQ